MSLIFRQFHEYILYLRLFLIIIYLFPTPFFGSCLVYVFINRPSLLFRNLSALSLFTLWISLLNIPLFIPIPLSVILLLTHFISRFPYSFSYLSCFILILPFILIPFSCLSFLLSFLLFYFLFYFYFLSFFFILII